MQAIIELQTGTAPQTPIEWPFTQETNEEQFTSIRLSKWPFCVTSSQSLADDSPGYIRGLRTLLVLAL